MTLSNAWRNFGVLLVAASTAVLPVLSGPIPAAADGSGTLFGITGTGQSMLSRIDPVAGTDTPMVELVGPNNGQVVTLTGDPSTHRIFGVRTTVTFAHGGISIRNRVLTINSQTGAFTEGGVVNEPVSEIAFDPSSNSLYLVGVNGLFRVNPRSGATSLVATLANVSGSVLSMAIDPFRHTIYVNNESQALDGSSSSQILAINPQTGAVSTSPVLDQPVRIITLDTSTGALFGATASRDLVRIDPVSGTETLIGNFDGFPGGIFEFAMTTDPLTHTVFMDLEEIIDFQTVADHIVAINDQTGAVTFSPGISDGVMSQYFEPIIATVTPESLRADVVQAQISGAIDNARLANVLLAELDSAAAARAQGKCDAATSFYHSFIRHLKAQAGSHIALTTAIRLAEEAVFLIKNCP